MWLVYAVFSVVDRVPHVRVLSECFWVYYFVGELAADDERVLQRTIKQSKESHTGYTYAHRQRPTGLCIYGGGQRVYRGIPTQRYALGAEYVEQFAEVMDHSYHLHPFGLSIPSDSLCSLEKVLNLRDVGLQGTSK